MHRTAKHLNVLIVEDRADDAEIMALGLEAAGYEIDWTRVDSQAAFAAAVNESVDVILADYTVPEFGVPPALDHLRDRGLDVPLIVVSGTLTEEAAVECLKGGAADFLVKDRLARLPAAVARAVEERRLREDVSHVADALRRSDQSFLQVFENDSVGMALLEAPSGRIRRANAALCTLIGYTEAELLDLTAADLSHPDDVEEQREVILDQSGEGASVRSTRRCRRKDGRSLWVAFSLTPFADDLGLLVVENITAQHEAEEALRASETMFRDLFVNSPVPMAIVEPGVCFHAANPAFCRMLGYTESELFEVGPAGISHPEDVGQSAVVAKGIERGEPMVFERRFVAKGGRTVIGLCRVARAGSDPAGPERAVAIVEDVTESRRIEGESARLASIVELSADAIVAKDRDGVITDWNMGAEVLYGYQSDEVIGQHINVLIPPELREREHEVRASVVAGRRGAHYRTQRLHKSGQLIAVDVAVSPVADASGTVVGAASASRSIEAQLRAEAMFRREHESRPANRRVAVARVAGAVSATLGMLVLVGWAAGAGAVKSVVPGFVAMKPVTAVCFVLLGVALVGTGARGWMRRLGLVATAGTLLVGGLSLVEYAMGRNLGSEVLFAGSFDSGPHPGRMAIATAFGFSALAIALLALAARRRLVAQGLGLMAFGGAGVAVIGYLYGIETLYSTSPNSTIAVHAAAGLVVASVGVLAAVPDGFVSHILGGAGTDSIMLRRMALLAFVAMPVAGGLIVLGHNEGLYDSSLNAALFVLVAIVATMATALPSARTIDLLDRQRVLAGEELITANDRIEARTRGLETANRELDRSNHDLEQFAYVASHDLKEPLRAVRGFSQLLVRDYQGRLDPQADEYLAFVDDGASRMQSLVDGLLVYSSVGTGANPQQFPLRSAVDTAVANLNSAVGADARIDVGELPDVVADPAQTVQILQNLIGNALKFRNDRSPVVRISAEVEGDWSIISVADNGIGIDPRHADQIFTVFQRLHARDEYPGTGIGLAICKKLVERWGGRIWIESEPGHGATFRFTIPGKAA